MRPKTNRNIYIYGLVFLIVIAVGLSLFFLFKPSNDNSTNKSTQGTTTTPTTRSTPTMSMTPTATITASTTPSVTATPSATPSTSNSPSSISSGTLSSPVRVKVMYGINDDPNQSNEQNSITTPGYVAYRLFDTTRADTENFVLEKIIEGPSQADQNAYFWFGAVKLSGESNCGNKDFELTKDTNSNTINVTLCKELVFDDINTKATARNAIKFSLSEFLSEDSPKNVNIKLKDGSNL